MMWLYLYLLTGCVLTLLFYPWEGKRGETLVSLIVVILWPVVFYYAFKAAQAQAKELRRKGGKAHPPASDPGQADQDQGKGGGA